MANTPVAWDQTPFYLAATSTFIAPGGPTTYAVARPVGPGGPNDVTSYHPGQRLWDDRDNLPSILYELRPCESWYSFKNSGLPPQKLDGNSNPMFEQHPEPGTAPRPLLDFKVLPDVIGTRESALIQEAWRRADGRIRWVDLTMRMDRAHRPNENALNMRLSRYWRPAYSLLSWHGKRMSTKEAGILALLSRAQRASNTTRGTTPGLIDPNLSEAGGRVAHPIPRNGRGQGRARRTIATPSSTEGDEGQSDISDETSDDGASLPEGDEKEDEEVDEEAIEGEDGEVYEEVDAIKELDPDEEHDLHAADGQESDRHGELLASAEEEYQSDSSLHSISQAAGRRTMSSGRGNLFAVENASNIGSLASIPSDYFGTYAHEALNNHSDYAFGPMEGHPPWSGRNQTEERANAGDKRKWAAIDDGSDDVANPKRCNLRDLVQATFEEVAADQFPRTTPMLYQWGPQPSQRALPEDPSRPDDHRSFVVVDPVLGDGRHSEVDELLSFANSSLNPRIIETGTLDHATFGIPEFNELEDHPVFSDAISQVDE